MIPTNNETYDFEVYKRKPNSKYEYEEIPAFTFSGRPANTMEIKTYRIQKGINGNSDSQFVLSSNLPDEVKPGDHVKYLGRIWTVQSTGYYYDASRIVNARAFNENQIMAKAPKGINIQ